MVQQLTQQIHSLWSILETSPDEQQLFQENVKSDLSNETITYVFSLQSLLYSSINNMFNNYKEKFNRNYLNSYLHYGIK